MSNDRHGNYLTVSFRKCEDNRSRQFFVKTSMSIIIKIAVPLQRQKKSVKRIHRHSNKNTVVVIIIIIIMGYDDMDEAAKRQVAGQCAFLMLSIVATASWICGLYSMSTCNFAERFVTLGDGLTPTEACADLGLNGSYAPVCDSLISNSTLVGFWGFEVTVPVNEQVCYGYTITMPWGYVNPYFDTKFNSARALIITANVLGGAAWFTLMFAACCKLDQAKMKCMGVYFSLACLFQGLGLLFLRSSACNVGFFATYFEGSGIDINTSDIVGTVSCGLATGAKLCISATVLYCCSNCLVGIAIPPEPVWPRGRGDQGGQQDEAQGEPQDEQAGEA